MRSRTSSLPSSHFSLASPTFSCAWPCFSRTSSSVSLPSCSLRVPSTLSRSPATLDPPLLVWDSVLPGGKVRKPLGYAYGDACRPPAKTPARPAYLGHRPLQLPLHVLHAEGGLREQLPLPPPRRAPHVRGDRAPRAALRRPGCPEGAADRRRTAPPPRRREARRDARRHLGARPHHDDERRAPDTEGKRPRGRRPYPHHREPRLPRRRRLQSPERRRLPGRPCPD